jgi:hypothetical protein
VSGLRAGAGRCGAPMSAPPSHQVALSTPTFHAVHHVARIDGVSPDMLVEQVVWEYLERRLEALRDAHDERARTDRGGRVIDLAAARTAQRPTRSSRSTGSRSRPSVRSL